MGDYAQALALNQEAIDWDTARHAPLALSVDKFLRGRILILMQKYSQAIEEFEGARKLSAMLNDTQGVAFADVRVCEARIELGQPIRTPAPRENPLFTFIAQRFADQVKETEALLARIDL